MKHFFLTLIFISALSVNSFAHTQEAKANGNKNTEATAAQLEESEKVLQNCYATSRLRRYYDCECYADKFLDGRIKAGPKAQKAIILQTFHNDCRNIPDSKKYEYTQCIKGIKRTPALAPNNIASEDFCQCYADQWAHSFESYQGLINMTSKDSMRMRAKFYCRRPENYPDPAP